MLRCILMFGISAVSVAMAIGAPYCAYEVSVKKPSGLPFAKTPVGVVDNGVQISGAITDAKGVARICDAPVHKVDIGVGAIGEGLILVKGVKPTWPETRNIVVIRDDRHWDEFMFPDECQVLLRIQDERGMPISGAQLDDQSSKGRAPNIASDSFGRLFRKLKSGEACDGWIRLQGRIPAPISAKCIRGSEEDVELKVVLKPR